MTRDDLAALQILLVEDSPEMRKTLRSALYGYGITHCTEAADGAEALLQLARRRFDVLVCDLRMAPMDGLSLIKVIRQGETITEPAVPIIIVSGYAEPNVVDEARALGIVSFLAKPVRPHDLFQRIVEVVQLRRRGPT